MFGLSSTTLSLLALGATCGIVSGFFLMVEIGEINRKVPESEQISYLGIHPVKMARIKSEYKRLYPAGRAELCRVIFQTVAFVLLVLAAVAAGAFRGFVR